MDVPYSLTLITPPASEPVTATEAKAAARIDGTSEDTLIEALIVAAREQVEVDSDRKLLPQTWRLTLDHFPAGPIRVPASPNVRSVTISYLDTTDTSQTLASGRFYVDAASCPARIYPETGYSWPSTSSKAAAVTVTFTVGYTDADDVPVRAKQAIKMLVGHWYQNRELATDRNTKAVEFAYQALTVGLRPGMV